MSKIYMLQTIEMMLEEDPSLIEMFSGIPLKQTESGYKYLIINNETKN